MGTGGRGACRNIQAAQAQQAQAVRQQQMQAYYHVYAA